MYPSQSTDFAWQGKELAAVLPVMLTLVSFVIYWFSAKSGLVRSWFYKRFTPDDASMWHLTFNRSVGFLAMGVVPGIICLLCLPGHSLADYGLCWKPETGLFTLFWTIVLSLAVIPLAFFSARKPKNLVNYPQIRALEWTWKTIVINAIGWALYLFGYEFLFRGLLLFPLVSSLGVWTAIAINIALYSATHIPKGLEETIGAMPLGLTLCVLTLISGTIWIAFLVHVVMAWTNSFTALAWHPDMRVKFTSW